jgi:hypothetical protein
MRMRVQHLSAHPLRRSLLTTHQQEHHYPHSAAIPHSSHRARQNSRPAADPPRSAIGCPCRRPRPGCTARRRGRSCRDCPCTGAGLGVSLRKMKWMKGERWRCVFVYYSRTAAVRRARACRPECSVRALMLAIGTFLGVCLTMMSSGRRA